MLKFNFATLIQMTSNLSRIEVVLNEVENPKQYAWKPDDLVDGAALLSEIQDLRVAAESLEAKLSLKLIDRIIKNLENRNSTYRELRSNLRALEERIHDELSLSNIFTVDARHAPYLSEDHPRFGASVQECFPSAEFDISEATICLGLQRSTACVMHLMRALEAGLSALAKALSISSDRANWQLLIDQIEKAIKSIGPANGSNWKQDQQFYAGAAIHFRALKDGWRNHAMHVCEKYTDAQATEIYVSTGSFLRHLASRIRE